MPKIAEIKQTIERINTQLNDQITQVGPHSLSPPLPFFFLLGYVEGSKVSFNMEPKTQVLGDYAY